MSTAVDRVLAALKDHGFSPRASGDGWAAKCPGHEDRKPSLSIHTGDDGRALVFCHVCGREETRRIVEAVGLTMQDLRADNGHRGDGQPKGPDPVTKVYEYHIGVGELLMQVCCTASGKKFVRRPDGKGDWINDVKGVARTLYRLPELLEAPRTAVVFNPEGEKDVDSLRAIGLVATCNPFGAGKWGKLDDDSALEGRSVVILPDNDEPGQRHAQDVAARLHGRAASVKVLSLPDLPDGGDVSDWLAAGGDPEDLDRMAQTAPEWEPTPEPERPPYVDEGESLAAINAMAETSRNVRSRMSRLCEEVLEWFNRRGPETLGKDFPISYAAAAVGVSRCHFHRLRQLGETRSLLRGRNTDELSDNTVTPLVKLLADHAEDVPEVFESAQRMAKAEGKKLRGRHTRAAVEQIIPPRSPEPAPDPPAPAAPSLVDLWRHVAKALDVANEVADVPKALHEAIAAATNLAYDVAHSPGAEGAIEDPDQLALYAGTTG